MYTSVDQIFHIPLSVDNEEIGCLSLPWGRRVFDNGAMASFPTPRPMPSVAALPIVSSILGKLPCDNSLSVPAFIRCRRDRLWRFWSERCKFRYGGLGRRHSNKPRPAVYFDISVPTSHIRNVLDVCLQISKSERGMRLKWRCQPRVAVARGWSPGRG